VQKHTSARKTLPRLVFGDFSLQKGKGGNNFVAGLYVQKHITRKACSERCSQSPILLNFVKYCVLAKLTKQKNRSFERF